MIEASPRETLPKNLWPALTSSSGPKLFGPCWRCGAGYSCPGGGGGGGEYCWPGGGGYCWPGGGNGWPCCAEAGAAKHSSAVKATAARREAIIMKRPLVSLSGRRLNLTPTSSALGCVQCPLDSFVIDINYDRRTAGKLPPRARNGLVCLSGGHFHSNSAESGRPGLDHRADCGEPLFGPRHRGVRSRGLFHRSPAGTGPARLRGGRGGRRLALSQRQQSRRLRRPSRDLWTAVRWLRPDRRRPRGGLCRQPPVL